MTKTYLLKGLGYINDKEVELETLDLTVTLETSDYIEEYSHITYYGGEVGEAYDGCSVDEEQMLEVAEELLLDMLHKVDGYDDWESIEVEEI